ncbi:hypothetical protein B0H15DRAFT_839565 [Mycena belliarum]|uniref:Uncharacterized protein n=1 Tax=Mycena belliarum TaxID=1033014 RepID=A0AAD6U970_9AGAR|nr:hypothetical protein B0H15DRAFT_839565 [Mycena belliae]
MQGTPTRVRTRIGTSASCDDLKGSSARRARESATFQRLPAGGGKAIKTSRPIDDTPTKIRRVDPSRRWSASFERLGFGGGEAIETSRQSSTIEETPRTRRAAGNSEKAEETVTPERLKFAGANVRSIRTLSSRLDKLQLFESRRRSRLDSAKEREPSLEKERLDLAREKVALEAERVQIERERLALERKKLRFEEENARVEHLIELLKLKQCVWPWFDLQTINEEIEKAR